VRREVDEFLRTFPQGPGLDQVEAVSQKLEASVAVDRRALGLLVPREGPMAAFGTQVMQGVELALDAANQGSAESDKIRLLVEDEGSGAAEAEAAAGALIEKDHVIGVLGPLDSDSAAALIPLLSSRRTPMLSPAAMRPGLQDVSPWFFRDILPPERQAAAMADYAVAARRLTRVASLAPENYYGTLSAQAFAKRMKELGGEVAVSLTYAPGTRDFRDAMLALGGVDPGEAKSADLDEKRDQQARVEEISSAFGKFLLDRSDDLTPTADAGGRTVTPRMRLMIVDFAQDTACAELNAGRSFADRFARTLTQIQDIDVVGPQAAERYWKSITATAEDLSLVELAQAGKAAGAQIVLAGGTAALPPDPVKWPHARLFNLTAQLVDSATALICAQKSFVWTKYQAPAANPMGLKAIYFPASAEDVALAVPGMQFFNLQIPLLGSDQWDRPDLRDHLAELEGAVFTSPYWEESPDGPARRFDEAYRAKYAAKPGVLAAQAFDAATLMAQAIRGGASDRASLRAFLAHVDGYDGASGRTGFNGHQDAVRQPALVQVQGGKLILLKGP